MLKYVGYFMRIYQGCVFSLLLSFSLSLFLSFFQLLDCVPATKRRTDNLLRLSTAVASHRDYRERAI